MYTRANKPQNKPTIAVMQGELIPLQPIKSVSRTKTKQNLSRFPCHSSGEILPQIILCKLQKIASSCSLCSFEWFSAA